MDVAKQIIDQRINKILEAQDPQLNVVLFQAKYSRKLDVDSHFPANAKRS